MKKIPTLFVRDWDGNPKYVTREVNPECEWVIAGEGAPTVKWDGTCVMLDDAGDWWARREVKQGKTPPPDFVPLSTDEETGKTIGWEPVAQSSFARYFEQALDLIRAHFDPTPPGTYELIGPKINGNPQNWPHHQLVQHGHADTIRGEDVKTAPRDYDGLSTWLLARPHLEGIVWHHSDGRRAKLKRRDFAPSA